MDPSYNNGFGSFGSGVAQQPSSVQPPSVQQPSNAQQDIILTPSSEKKPKKWLVVVILLLVGLGLTAGVVALVMWKGDVVGGGNAVEDFKELVSYIEDVPEDYDWSWLEESNNGQEESWIYAILVAEQDFEIQRDYYAELDRKWNSFLSGNGKKVSTGLLERYKNALIILDNAMNYQAKRDELLAEYDKDGVVGAKKYLDDKLKCSDNDDAIGAICKAETKYYDLIFQECTSGNIEDEEELYSYIERFSNSTAKVFLNVSIKKMNAEIMEELNV